MKGFDVAIIQHCICRHYDGTPSWQTLGAQTTWKADPPSEAAALLDHLHYGDSFQVSLKGSDASFEPSVRNSEAPFLPHLIPLSEDTQILNAVNVSADKLAPSLAFGGHNVKRVGIYRRCSECITLAATMRPLSPFYFC